MVTGEEKLFGVLSYLGILVLIPLLVKKDNPWILDHAKQGLMLAIISVILAFVVSFLTFIPFLGLIFGLLSLPLYFVIFVLWLWAVINVLTGKEWTLPVLGSYARSWNF